MRSFIVCPTLFLDILVIWPSFCSSWREASTTTEEIVSCMSDVHQVNLQLLKRRCIPPSFRILCSSYRSTSTEISKAWKKPLGKKLMISYACTALLAVGGGSYFQSRLSFTITIQGVVTIRRASSECIPYFFFEEVWYTFDDCNGGLQTPVSQYAIHSAYVELYH